MRYVNPLVEGSSPSPVTEARDRQSPPGYLPSEVPKAGYHGRDWASHPSGLAICASYQSEARRTDDDPVLIAIEPVAGAERQAAEAHGHVGEP